jgi:uncharacterized protein (TIGR02284 family)
MRLTIWLLAPLLILSAGCARGTIESKEVHPNAAQAATETEIETLNQMVSILIDANTLYREAAALPDEPGIAAPIIKIADKRNVQRSELQDIIMESGAAPDTYGEALGTAHRSWTQARTAMESDTKVAIQEVLRGEYYIIKIIDECHQGPLSEKSSDWLNVLKEDVNTDIETLQTLLVSKGYKRFKRPA